jgi:hypothetical protein
MRNGPLQGTTGAWWDEFFADRSKDSSLGGGLGYSEASLRSLWDKPPFSVRILRQMNQAGSHGPYFGLDFLWAMLATRQGEPWVSRGE